MNALQVYALLNKKIKGLVSGIQSASVDGTTIKFTMNDGSVQTMVFPTPKDGASVTDLEVKKVADKYHLIGTITDANGNDTEIDAGEIPGADVSIATKDKAGIVKVGDNLEITSDGTLSAIGGGKPYEISKADYDALTEEERKDKVFYVYDDYSDGGSGSGSVITEDIECTTTIGQITTGKVYPAGTSIEEIIRDILISYTKAGLTVKLIPSDELYDAVEDTLSNITISAVTTKGTNDIVSIKYYVDGNNVKELTSGCENGGTFNYDYTFATPINKTFVVKVEVSDGDKVTSQTKTVSFVPKTYYGTVDDSVDTFDEILVKSLNSVLKNSRKYIYKNITMDFGRVLYAIPTTLGKVTSIKDEVNNFDYTNSFEETEITIDGYSYYLYMLKDCTSADDVQLTFT